MIRKANVVIVEMVLYKVLKSVILAQDIISFALDVKLNNQHNVQITDVLCVEMA